MRARAGRYVATRIPTDECGAAPSLLCGPQGTRSALQRARRPPSGGLQRTHEPWVRSEGERHVTHASTRLCPLCMPLGVHTCALFRAGRYVATRIPLTRVPPRPLSCVVRRILTLNDNRLTCVPLLITKYFTGYFTGYWSPSGPRVTCVVSFVHLTCVPRACLRAHALATSLSCAAQTTSSGPQRTRRRSVWSLPRAKKV